jgi:hypothetical protein
MRSVGVRAARDYGSVGEFGYVHNAPYTLQNSKTKPLNTKNYNFLRIILSFLTDRSLTIIVIRPIRIPVRPTRTTPYIHMGKKLYEKTPYSISPPLGPACESPAGRLWSSVSLLSISLVTTAAVVSLRTR